MKQATIVAIILGVLLLISAVQTFQLTQLKTKLAGDQLTIGTASSTKSVAAPGNTARKTASLPTSIKDLPQMVGGC